MTRVNDVAVLNTIQAVAADAVFSGGKLMLNDGTDDLLTNEINLAFAVASTKTAFVAGTAKITGINLGAVTLLADTMYRLAVVFPSRIGFNNTQVISNGGLQSANQLIPVREYVVSSGSVAPTATALALLFINKINDDLGALVTAAAGAAGILDITQDDVADGEFTVEMPVGGVEVVGTAFVAPAGTPALVEVDAPNQSAPAGQYTTYTIDVNMLRRHNGVSGGQVFFPEIVRIFLEEGAANFAALAAEMDAIIAGTHTPVADYVGI